METKERKVGRPKAPPRTGPLVLGEDYARAKVTLEISERVEEELRRVHALGREIVRHLCERGEVQDGRFRAARDLPPRPCLAGRETRAPEPAKAAPVGTPAPASRPAAATPPSLPPPAPREPRPTADGRRT